MRASFPVDNPSNCRPACVPDVIRSTPLLPITIVPGVFGMPENEIAERVEHSLAEVGLRGIEKKNSFHLSFGQKKLVSIATVLAMDARILVFDEPTAGLDPRSRRQIMNLLKSLWALTPPGAVINLIRRSNAQGREAVVETSIGSAPYYPPGDSGQPWIEVEGPTPSGNIEYSRVIRKGRKSREQK